MAGKASAQEGGQECMFYLHFRHVDSHNKCCQLQPRLDKQANASHICIIIFGRPSPKICLYLFINTSLRSWARERIWQESSST